jgi:hypothetical protein
MLAESPEQSVEYAKILDRLKAEAELPHVILVQAKPHFAVNAHPAPKSPSRYSPQYQPSRAILGLTCPTVLE